MVKREGSQQFSQNVLKLYNCFKLLTRVVVGAYTLHPLLIACTNLVINLEIAEYYYTRLILILCAHVTSHM